MPVDPAGAFTARSVDDVIRAVATARRTSLPLRLNTTGHSMGRAGPPASSLLLRPLIDAPVRIDAATRTARVPAGKTWGEVLPGAVEQGLTAVHGSSAPRGPGRRPSRAAVVGDEENDLLPLVPGHVTQAEWDALNKRARGNPPKSLKLGLVSLGAMLEDATGEERRRFLVDLPPPVRLLWRLFGKGTWTRSRNEIRRGKA